VRGRWWVARTAFSRKASSLELSGRSCAGAGGAASAEAVERARAARAAGTMRGIAFAIEGRNIAVDRRFFAVAGGCLVMYLHFTNARPVRWRH
jgi:hypothetical protein